jgi:hypothetical protein
VNGACDYQPFNDGTGGYSFVASGSPYFAYVIVDNGVATGSWNPDGGGHAQTDLGQLSQNGACRYNDRAIVCAWAK